MSQRLVALRIPPGWAVTGNDFVEWSIDDPVDRVEALSFLSEDLLRIVQTAPAAGGEWATVPDGTMIDLGWIGSGEDGGLLDGEYDLSVVRGDWDGDDWVKLQRRDWRVMRDAIDLALSTVFAGRSPLRLNEAFARIAAEN